MADDSLLQLTKVLAALGLPSATAEAFPTGNINRSWLITVADEEQRVLQCVNPMFPAAINTDIDVVTQHLEAQGLITPRLIPTPKGDLATEMDGAIWRQFTFIPGRTVDAISSDHQASQAGAMLGQFHHAVATLNYNFANARLGVHDTAAHLDNLRRALTTQEDHREFESVRALARKVFALAEQLPSITGQPDRVVHGDPKISNIVFTETTDDAICMIDLDTVGRMPIVLELGDAFRSWCNPLSEDDPSAIFSARIFESGVVGYAQKVQQLLEKSEWQQIPVATLTITLELAARFCADALNESYFRWDSSRFENASEHNQARTKSQLSLARSIYDQFKELDRLTSAAFKG